METTLKIKPDFTEAIQQSERFQETLKKHADREKDLSDRIKERTSQYDKDAEAIQKLTEKHKEFAGSAGLASDALRRLLEEQRRGELVGQGFAQNLQIGGQALQQFASAADSVVGKLQSLLSAAGPAGQQLSALLGAVDQVGNLGSALNSAGKPEQPGPGIFGIGARLTAGAGVAYAGGQLFGQIARGSGLPGSEDTANYINYFTDVSKMGGDAFRFLGGQETELGKLNEQAALNARINKEIRRRHALYDSEGWQDNVELYEHARKDAKRYETEDYEFNKKQNKETEATRQRYAARIHTDRPGATIIGGHTGARLGAAFAGVLGMITPSHREENLRDDQELIEYLDKEIKARGGTYEQEGSEIGTDTARAVREAQRLGIRIPGFRDVQRTFQQNMDEIASGPKIAGQSAIDSFVENRMYSSIEGLNRRRFLAGQGEADDSLYSGTESGIERYEYQEKRRAQRAAQEQERTRQQEQETRAQEERVEHVRRGGNARTAYRDAMREIARIDAEIAVLEAPVRARQSGRLDEGGDPDFEARAALVSRRQALMGNARAIAGVQQGPATFESVEGQIGDLATERSRLQARQQTLGGEEQQLESREAHARKKNNQEELIRLEERRKQLALERQQIEQQILQVDRDSVEAYRQRQVLLDTQVYKMGADEIAQKRQAANEAARQAKEEAEIANQRRLARQEAERDADVQRMLNVLMQQRRPQQQGQQQAQAQQPMQRQVMPQQQPARAMVGLQQVDGGFRTIFDDHQEGDPDKDFMGLGRFGNAPMPAGKQARQARMAQVYSGLNMQMVNPFGMAQAGAGMVGGMVGGVAGRFGIRMGMPAGDSAANRPARRGEDPLDRAERLAAYTRQQRDKRLAPARRRAAVEDAKNQRQRRSAVGAALMRGIRVQSGRGGQRAMDDSIAERFGRERGDLGPAPDSPVTEHGLPDPAKRSQARVDWERRSQQIDQREQTARRDMAMGRPQPEEAGAREQAGGNAFIDEMQKRGQLDNNQISSLQQMVKLAVKQAQDNARNAKILQEVKVDIQAIQQILFGGDADAAMQNAGMGN